ncbi:DUF2948 family protein [Flavimaricola marinus]|uniref:DUF2948 domain-containing protein n=1 Tax=Flavimaricola marinus TaxID=1819565 RepID=A0A238LEN1_9RHOB|nr:DUF2948 family protein [Flavimaricola marinus]SMY08013.1 hypothetical protein LOM8899_02160 [Flavimaricola marinus]
MTRDASFKDGADKPLRLQAFDADDLAVISALVQDAVFPADEIRWIARERRFAILLNRFRWEDAGQTRSAERVRSLLVIDEVERVRSQGVPKGDAETVLSLLSLVFEPGDEGRGRVVLTLAGDGVIEIEVAVLEVVLRDVTRPYAAPSGRAPSHPE